MDLNSAIMISSAGMRAQSTRLRVVSENLANADSTGQTPGADAFRRKTIQFGQRRDAATGNQLVQITRFDVDRGEQPLRYQPGHPGANAAGYVRHPNVQPLLELTDMREAQRSYEACLSTQMAARSMLERTLQILR